MGDDHGGAVKVVEVVGQPLNVGSIKVVRRFVEQDNIRILQKHLCQDDL